MCALKKISAFCLLLILFLTSTPAFATLTIDYGIKSNFVLDEDRVTFIQADDTLTQLQLSTGEVLIRKTDADLYGVLQLFNTGILNISDHRMTFLNRNTLEIIWDLNPTYDSVVAGEVFVTHDRNGDITCRNITTAQVIWSYQLSRKIKLKHRGIEPPVVRNNKVLIYRPDHYCGAEAIPTVILLDLKTGKELLNKTIPPDIHFLTALFDGKHIYFPAGKFSGQYDPQLGNSKEGRPSARFEELVVWDLEGNIEDTFPAPSESLNQYIGATATFVFNNKVFSQGRIWESIKDYKNYRRKDGYGFIDEIAGDKVYKFLFNDGIFTVTLQYDMNESHSYIVELKTSEASWRGVLPYLIHTEEARPYWGYVYVVGATKDLLLIGTNLGQVECVEKKSGKSLWMYIFPTKSFARCSDYENERLYQDEMARIYKENNIRRDFIHGIQIEGSDEISRPKLIYDPKPMNPFKDLPGDILEAWSSAIIIAAAVGIILLIQRKKAWGVKNLTILQLLLTIAAISCFLVYGRVSLYSSVALKISIFLSLAVAFFYSAMAIRKKCSIYSSLLLLSSLFLLLLAFYVFDRVYYVL